jgi:hypothetical protein
MDALEQQLHRKEIEEEKQRQNEFWKWKRSMILFSTQW